VGIIQGSGGATTTGFKSLKGSPAKDPDDRDKRGERKPVKKRENLPYQKKARELSA